MTEEQKNRYEQFINHMISTEEHRKWQVQMAVEESLEFSLAMLHMARGKANRDDLVTEIADIENMIGQIKALHNVTEEEVWNERDKKIIRAAKKLNINFESDQK
jgi:hypothetical protein